MLAQTRRRFQAAIGRKPDIQASRAGLDAHGEREPVVLAQTRRGFQAAIGRKPDIQASGAGLDAHGEGVYMYQTIYEDTDLCIVRKPAGLAVQHASFGRKDLESMLKTYYYEKTGRTNPYLGVVHRLDQPVQGLVAFALNSKSAASLSAQVQDGRMKKTYCAVVCGHMQAREGSLVHFLKKDAKTNRSEAVPEGTPGSRRAELRYHAQKEENGLTWLQIELLTGRHHQIRVQLSANGTPLFGDQKYNPAAKRGEQIALCASGLTLMHPRTGKKMEFSCEPDFLLPKFI